MKAVLVPAAKTHHAWPHIAVWVSEALIRGSADLSPEEIRQHLDRGSMQLWLVWDGKPVGVCITELVDSVRGRACNLVIVAGDKWRNWAHLLAEVERWAREDWGCVRLSLIGRKGWARRLAGDGWQEVSVTLEKRIGADG